MLVNCPVCARAVEAKEAAASKVHVSFRNIEIMARLLRRRERGLVTAGSQRIERFEILSSPRSTRAGECRAHLNVGQGRTEAWYWISLDRQVKRATPGTRVCDS